MDPGHNSGKAGNLQLAVDIEVSGAQDFAFAVRYRYGVITGRGIIRGGDGGRSVQKLRNFSRLSRAVGQGDRHAVSRLQVSGGNVHRHEAVQGQEQQSAPFI